MRILFVSLGVVIVDQISKLLVKGFSIPFLHINYSGMYPGQRIPIIDDFFRLTFIENPGMAFGFDPGLNMKLWVSIFSLLASVGLIIYLYVVRRENLMLRISIALIIGGAVGNLIDRMFYGVIYNYAPLFYGRVVDFMDFDFFNFSLFGKSYDRWPIFNVADVSVSIGVILLLLFYKRHEQKEKIQQSVADTGNPEAGISNSEEDYSLNNKINEEDITKDKTKNDEADNGKEIQL